MHGPTCIFWVNLTPFSLKLGRRDWAAKEWAWFKESGMINAGSLVNDGLGRDCKKNGRRTYTYNQGVILGGNPPAVSHSELPTHNFVSAR